MANAWFRMYSEFADDPKVQMMSEVDQRRLLMLFCERCKDVKHDETLRAFHWRITPLELNATKAIFLQFGFIDEDWNVLNWNRRQYISDSSNERVKRYRERKKQSETLQSPFVTAPDTDTDTDSEQIHTQKQKKQKPSRGEPASDARHTLFKELFFDYATQATGMAPDWDGRQAKALKTFLSGSPLITVDHWKQILTNRANSEVAHGEALSAWIRSAKTFYNHPLDRFGKPKTGGTNGTGKHNKTDGNYAALQRFVDAGPQPQTIDSESIADLGEHAQRGYHGNGGDRSLRGGADAGEPSAVHPCVQPSARDLQVLPQPGRTAKFLFPA